MSAEQAVAKSGGKIMRNAGKTVRHPNRPGDVARDEKPRLKPAVLFVMMKTIVIRGG